MECCICYNEISKSYITCHSICCKCHHKIKNNKCPMCRNQMIVKDKIIKIDVVEIETATGQKEFRQLKKLNKFVFSDNFKRRLCNVLYREYLQYKKAFVIIDYKKYDYDEILDCKTFDSYMNFKGTNEFVFMNLIDRMIDTTNIYRLTKIDLFHIKNIVNHNEYETSESRLIKYIWNREKYKYNII